MGDRCPPVADGWLLPALAAAYEAAGQPTAAGRVAVGLARGSRHELGILAFAVALRCCGLDVVYVDADLSPEAWLELVGNRSPVAVVVAAPTLDDVAAVTETVVAISGAHPNVRSYIGGAWQEHVQGAETLGHEVGPAARSIASALRS